MKLFLTMLFLSVLLAGIAYRSSATPFQGGGETAAQAANPTTSEPATPVADRSETIAEAARTTMSGVPIVERGGIGARAAERTIIQSATDTDFGRGQHIVDYVRDAFTAYCFTWSASEKILDQVVPGAAPCAVTP